jgi:hypothetical protein
MHDAPSDRIDARLFALAATAVGVLLLALAWPLLAGDLYVAGDLNRFHLPFRWFYAQALAEGHSYAWFPYEFGGFHLHGEGQIGMAHPLNRLQYGVLPFQPAFAVEFLRSWVLLALGTHLLLRRLGQTRSSAAFGALLFTFGSFNFLHFTHLNFTGIVSHLPWLLLCTDVALRETDRRKVALARLGVSLFTASQLLHAHPQMTWMSMLVQGLYVLDWLLLEYQTADRERRRSAVGVLLPLVGALVVGFAMAGAQLVPLWDGLRESVKSDPTLSFTNTYALAPINLGQLVAPYLFDGRTVGRNTSGFALYAGAAVPVLIAWLMIVRGRAGRAWPLARWGLAVAVVGFVLALGESGGLYRLQQLLPVVGKFRAPGRYILVCELGLAVAGAVAFGGLVRRVCDGERSEWRALWPLALPLLASLALSVAVWGGVRRTWVPGELAGVVAGPALVALATALVVAAARGQRIALAGLVLLTAVDLGAYGLSYLRETPPAGVEAWRSKESVPRLAAGQRLNRGSPMLTTHGVRLAGGYVSLYPARTLPVGRAAPALRGVDVEVIRNSLRVSSVAIAFGRPVEDPLPRVRMLADAMVSPDVLTNIGRIDVATTALVAEPVEVGPGPPGSARLLLDRPGELRIATDSTTPQLLVVSESHHPGWRADAGEARCELIRVYADYMGCRLEPGRHEVVLRFEPASHWQGLWLSGVGLALGALAWGLSSGRLRVPGSSAKLRS